MYRAVNVLIAILFSLTAGFSQRKVDFKDIDKLSYELYLAQDWKQLVRIGKQAIKSDIDYFYLRMRVGIAYYERKNYSKAIPHFQKALEFNSSDDIAQEYLYFSYLFTGQDIVANIIAKGFSKKLKEKLNYNYVPGIRSFTLEAGFDFTQDSIYVEELSLLVDPAIDGRQVISKGFQYYHAGIQHDAGRRSRMFHSVSYLSKRSLFYLQDGGIAFSDPNNRITQLQYFMGMNIYMGNGFYVYPSFHYINVSSPYLVTVQGRWGSQYNILQYDNKSQFAGFLGLAKNMGRIKPELTAAYMYLNNESYIQGGLFFSYFPFGNLNLYLTGRVYYHFPAYDYRSGRFIFFQELGFKALDNLWFELWISEGSIQNFSGNSGFLIYSDLSTISSHYGGNLIIPLFRSGVEFSVRFRYSVLESGFIPEDGEIINRNTINTKHNTITGGIKWKF